MERILFTGASGFIGRNIKPLLEKEYIIKTIGLDKSDDYNIDISKVIPTIEDYYDIIIHAAGKAHSTPKTQQEEKVFFDVNYQGTINLCKGLENMKAPKAFIFISTVAVYGCDSGENINEEQPLCGNTPYAVSKIQAEKYLIKWAQARNIKLAILRPSLIAGPTPPGNLGDMITGIKTGRYLSIAGGKARKSILMVYDIANLVPLLITKGGIYNVCDDTHPSFHQLEKLISSQLKKCLPFNIPYWLAKLFAVLGDFLGKKAPINSLKLRKIAQSLTFDNSKAKNELNWTPMDVLGNFRINN
jgi:nucleoside-diphosphate-sugar epimerase